MSAVVSACSCSHCCCLHLNGSLQALTPCLPLHLLLRMLLLHLPLPASPRPLPSQPASSSSPRPAAWPWQAWPCASHPHRAHTLALSSCSFPCQTSAAGRSGKHQRPPCSALGALRASARTSHGPCSLCTTGRRRRREDSSGSRASRSSMTWAVPVQRGLWHEEQPCQLRDVSRAGKLIPAENPGNKPSPPS